MINILNYINIESLLFMIYAYITSLGWIYLCRNKIKSLSDASNMTFSKVSERILQLVILNMIIFLISYPQFIVWNRIRELSLSNAEAKDSFD